MKYEIINPSDLCFITSEDPILAKIACAILGKGFYGLRSETGEIAMPTFASMEESTGMTTTELGAYINGHVTELAQVFRSFEYKTKRTSLNDIGGYAKSLADTLEEKEGNNA